MAEWIYFIHPPREDFAATMTPEEREVWAAHFDRLQRLLVDGVMIAVGPTLGPINTGIAIFEAPTRRRPGSWKKTRPSRAASHGANSGPSVSRCSADATIVRPGTSSRTDGDGAGFQPRARGGRRRLQGEAKMTVARC
jgi:uncharacterized protein YciI